MKNLKTALIILFAVIIAILIFFLAKNIKNNNNSSKNDKLISEINYMDSKITSLLNSTNNISLDNYKIIATKTSTGSNQSLTSGTGTSSENKSGNEQQDVQGRKSTRSKWFECKLI